MNTMKKTQYEVGQRIYWKNPNTGRQFYAQVRAIHPSVDGYYSLDAVFADNCLDMPDNWAAERDMQPRKLVDCCHCDGGKIKWIGFDGRGSCYCGNTGKLDVTVTACCTCGEVNCRCEI